METSKTSWKCPYCSASFGVGAASSVELAIESHLDVEACLFREWIDAVLPTVERPEVICKAEDCDSVALYRVHVSADCDHEHAGPSDLCERHKTQAMHPSYRMICDQCLDETGLYRNVFISDAELIYRAVTTEGN